MGDPLAEWVQDQIETWVCGECGASFDLIETIGTSCPYFRYCPSCGMEYVTE